MPQDRGTAWRTRLSRLPTHAGVRVTPKCSPAPRTRPVGGVGDGVFGDDGVLADLEIEHADADEVGPVLEGVLETNAGMDGAGRQDLEGDPGCGHAPLELNGSLRRDGPDVVVVVRPDGAFGRRCRLALETEWNREKARAG